MTAATTEHQTITWNNQSILLAYEPRRYSVIDHLEIRSENGDPLPITETGYKSHYFGPVDPVMTMDDIAQMVIEWLDEAATSKHWRDYLNSSRQLSLF